MQLEVTTIFMFEPPILTGKRVVGHTFWRVTKNELLVNSIVDALDKRISVSPTVVETLPCLVSSVIDDC